MSKHKLGVSFNIEDYQWGCGNSRAVAIQSKLKEKNA